LERPIDQGGTWVPVQARVDFQQIHPDWWPEARWGPGRVSEPVPEPVPELVSLRHVEKWNP
jgi:hypothetical protein